MYMCRIIMKPDASENKNFWRNLKDTYETHRTMWSLFADGSKEKRDFLYRHEKSADFPTFYTVSKSIPVDTSGVWIIASKPYNPTISVGQKLSFSLCANPICSKRDDNNKQHRHDIVMNEKNRLKNEGIPREKWPAIELIIQKAGFGWLARKGEQYGFTLKEDEIRVDGYSQEKFYKTKGKNSVNISTMDFTGLFSVTDPKLFKDALYHGIGPAKGFGCGLLLVRPV